MSDVDDHGLEVIKKAAEYVDPASPTKKKDYYLKVGGSPSGDPIPPIPVIFDNPSTPKITNLLVPNQNIEVEHVLVPNCRRFLLRARGNSRVQFSFVSGESSTNFVTIPLGGYHEVDNVEIPQSSIFLQLNKDGDTVEILEWS